MGNPSTIWGQLTLPASPVGCVPYLSLYGITITVDAANFTYIPVGASLSGTKLEGQLSLAKGFRLGYSENLVPAVGLTLNSISGRGFILLGRTTLIVVNNCCFAKSIVQVQLEGSHDATLTRVTVTPNDGLFLITGNAAATGNVQFNFVIHNPII